MCDQEYVVDVGVNMYIYMYVCMWPQKCLNSTLVIDLPFQTLAVD